MKSTANDVFMKIVLLNKSFHLFGNCNHSTYHTDKQAKQTFLLYKFDFNESALVIYPIGNSTWFFAEIHQIGL
jgi:hypothetical protein